MTAGLTAVRCPRCGGTPDPEGGPGLLARCDSCGVLGRIHDAFGSPALVVLPALADGALPAIVEAAAEGRPLALGGSELLFVPFWRVESLVAGHVSGERPHVEKVIERHLEMDEQGRGSMQAVYTTVTRDAGVERVDREVQRVHVALVSGCPLDEIGLPTLDRRQQLPGRLGLQRRFDAGQVVVFHGAIRALGTVLDPLVGRDRALAEADAVLDAARAGVTAGLLPGATGTSEVLARDVSEVFYPVFLCQVTAGNGRGTMCVDGVTGEVVAMRLPPVATDPTERRLIGLSGLLAGLVGGAVLRAALFTRAVFGVEGDIETRFRLAGVALVVLGGSAFVLSRLAARMERPR